MSHIKLSVPNDDSCALFHIGKSLIELSATIEGSPEWVVITRAKYGELQALKEATHIITSEEKVGEPVDLGDDNFSQGYRFEVEELVKQARPVPEFEKMVKEASEEGLAFMKKAEDFLNPQSEAPTTDSTDTPWDERIHSASKASNADGTWRLRRKPKDMDEVEWNAYVETVKAELMWKGVGAEVIEQLTSAEMDNSGEPPVTTPGDDFHVDAGVVTEQQVADIPPPPPVPVAQKLFVYEDKNEPYTFPQVMTYLTERHGRISNAQVEQIIAEMGLKSIMDLNTQPEHTGPFIARVKALLGE